MQRFRDLAEGLLATARTGDERSLAFQFSRSSRWARRPRLDWLDRALAEAETPRQRQSVESDYVTEATVGGDLAEGTRHAREALRLAEELDDPATLADALSMVARHEQLLGLGLRRDLLERVDPCTSSVSPIGSRRPSGLSETTVASSGILATADKFTEARSRSVPLHRLLERQGLVQPLPEVLRFRAELECLAGDWELARKLTETGDELAEQTGRDAIREDLLYPRAFVAAHRGDHETARALAHERSLRRREPNNHRNLMRHLSVLGFLDLSLHDLARCGRTPRAGLGVASAAGYVEPNWLRFHDDLGEVLVGLGRLDEAAALVAWLDERGAATGYPWTLTTAARCRGQLLA